MTAQAEYEMMMNSSVSPCEDFYLHTCQGWIQASSISYEEYLKDKTLRDLNDTLYHTQLGRNHPSWNMVTFYRSCYDFHRISVPLHAVVAKSIESLGMSLQGMLSQAKKSIVQIAPGLSVHRKLGFSKEANVYIKKVMTYTDYSIFNDTITARLMWYDMVTEGLQQESEKSDRNTVKVVPVVQLPEVEDKLSWIDWRNAINGNMNTTWKLGEFDIVQVVALDQMTQMTKTFFDEDRKLVALYMFIQAVVELLKFDFARDYNPHETCIRTTYDNFPGMVLNSAAIMLTRESGHLITILNGIREQVISEVSSAEWLDETTRPKAETKLKAVKIDILQYKESLGQTGAPDMGPDFLHNFVAMRGYNKDISVRFPHATESAEDSPLFRDYRYSSIENTVFLPSYIMTLPSFVKEEQDDFINYATIGSRLAALLSLAISESGSHVDPTGLQLDWWSKKTQELYNESVACYVEHYLDKVDFQNPVSADVRDALYASARGLAVALSMATLVDSRAEMLFFGRYCQQFCLRDFDKKPSPLPSRHLCEFSVVNQPKFFKTYGCGHLTRIGSFQNCEIM
ncbi:neprilysin-1-like [Ornithodoros turicata]|uniref:neprilysin-1-like n=1 Tax=Ornithodoros turicata TaxID=34597 RepID=UPI003138EF44